MNYAFLHLQNMSLQQSSISRKSFRRFTRILKDLFYTHSASNKYSILFPCFPIFPLSISYTTLYTIGFCKRPEEKYNTRFRNRENIHTTQQHTTFHTKFKHHTRGGIKKPNMKNTLSESQKVGVLCNLCKHANGDICWLLARLWFD